MNRFTQAIAAWEEQFNMFNDHDQETSRTEPESDDLYLHLPYPVNGPLEAIAAWGKNYNRFSTSKEYHIEAVSEHSRDSDRTSCLFDSSGQHD